MLKLTFGFLIITLVAGVFAFTNISTAVPDIAQIIFLAFLVLFLVALIGWLLFRRRAQSRML
ncbi:MAG: DUF1328 domain-containing protein [Proteobacteria bacterium]|nr:DUF1328 domain-containing protein [Pseudomonadota bacterium]MBU4597181.1 DUF1328 domain-containing protein [Pseudomonadota bacterium]